MPLPSFIIAGGRRCGTTSLYHWISSHPEVYLFEETDTAYFIEEELVGRTSWMDGKVDTDAWERTHDIKKYSERFETPNGCRAIGEKSADLLYWKSTHPRLARYLPDGRFIIILRNPVKRAWSQYWNEVGKGRETLSFEEAVAAEEERCLKSDYANHHLSYRKRGYYDLSLQSFFEHTPSNRVLVLIFEQMINAPEQGLKRIYDFIGVNPELGLQNAGSQHNSNWTMVKYRWVEDWAVLDRVEQIYRRGLRRVTERLLRGRPDRHVKKREIYSYLERIFRKPAAKLEIPQKIRLELVEDYNPHIEALEKMLGFEISEWR